MRRALLALLVAGVVAPGTAAIIEATAATSSEDLLPDLAAGAPTLIQVRTERTDEGRTRYLLSFESKAENVGRGALIVRASRPGRKVAAMTADQIVLRADGSIRRLDDVGTLRYVIDPTHQHWHLDRAMAYELVPIGGTEARRRPDEKTGFCLGDRYELPGFTSPAEPVDKVYDVNCGFDRPGLLRVEEGISVGWGDNYEPWRDGQQIDLTGLPAGRYRLVHRVNPDRSLHELRHGNNGASAVIELAWPGGADSEPSVRLLKSCRGTTRCAT
jgi:hypothetical protein